MKIPGRRVVSALVLCSTMAFQLSPPDAGLIINQSIARHGGVHYQQVEIEFDFREKHYKAIKKKDGSYRYERCFEETGEQIRDVLNNNGFYREINGERVVVPEKKSIAYSNSVNSVIYFALLPYGLNDKAVNKTYLGEAWLLDKPYHKIKVTFNEEGGGDGYNDVFIYWIHKKERTVDYLAYSFHENGGGLRFRVACNRRKVNKITFQDYINFKSGNPATQVEQLDSLYLNNALEELSKIELKNIRVSAI